MRTIIHLFCSKSIFLDQYLINTNTFDIKLKELIYVDLLNRSPMNERLKDSILLVLERVDEVMLRLDKLSAELTIPGSRFDIDATERIRVLYVGSDTSSAAKFKNMSLLKSNSNLRKFKLVFFCIN